MLTMKTDQAIELVNREFNFSVFKEALETKQGQETPLYGLFRSDTGKYINGTGSVTKDYVAHQAPDVCALVESASSLFENEVGIRCYFNKGHYVSIAPTKDYRRDVYGTSDNVFPRIIISAGYNGKAFKAIMAMYRDLCLNMSMLQTVKSSIVSIRHTSGLYDHMNDLKVNFDQLGSSWNSVTETIDQMQSNNVQLDQFINSIYGLPLEGSQRSLTIHQNRTRDIFNRILRERKALELAPIDTAYTVSGWEAFNAIQGYTQHDKTRKGQVSDIGRAINALFDQDVKHAEQLALVSA